MVSVRNVSKSFGGTTAVKDISFEVAQGQNFILLGTSGCGKTTTLRMINRLVEPSSGAVFINGVNVSNQPPELLRRNMGYVLQRNSLFPHYTVAQNIAVVPELLKWDKHKITNRIDELLEKLHLPADHLHRYPLELSGGEAQRVNLARALVANPLILLMDEPFSALDTITRAVIRKEFQQLDELKKKTIIMVTHDVQEAFEMGDVICLMDKGEVMQIGTPADLLYHPVNDFVRDFFSDAFLQLSFTITTLEQIWLYLDNEESPGTTANIELQSIDTISKAMEQMKNKNDENLRLSISHSANNERKLVSWKNIIQAFSKHQTKK
jgi:osmoprotectant transport system ATP-binding protein